MRYALVAALLVGTGCSLTALDGYSGGGANDATETDATTTDAKQTNVTDSGTIADVIMDGSTEADAPVATLGQGLLAWWRFDEGAGTTASDSTGRGNNGTLTNGTTWAAGIAGGALSLDGIDDSVTVPENGTLATTEALSVAVWVKPSASTFATLQQGRIVNRTSAWDVKFNGNSPQLGTTSRYCIAESTFVAGEWRHLVVTFVHGVVSFFVDAVPQGIRVTTFTGTETLDPGSYGLRVGAFSNTQNFAGGLLDDLRIYNRALTIDEIKSLARR